MNTNMTGFRWLFKNLGILVLWTKVAVALEELRVDVCHNVVKPLPHYIAHTTTHDNLQISGYHFVLLEHCNTPLIDITQ